MTKELSTSKDEGVMGKPTNEGISDDLPIGDKQHGSGCGISEDGYLDSPSK